MTRCLAASGTEQRHFFLGASDAMRERLKEILKQRFPALTIVGGYSPPFGDWDDAEDAKICRAIRESEAQLVWVGLGCPRQEEFLARMKDRLPWGVYLAVGAAFRASVHSRVGRGDRISFTIPYLSGTTCEK